MDNIIERARILRGTIEEMAQGLDDSAAESVPELFPEWKPEGCSYMAGDRVRFEGVLYKVLQPHTSQSGWTPGSAVSLFARVLPGQDGTEIGEWTQPDSTNPYKKGDRVTFEGKTYESAIDGNVWNPTSYPQGWKLIE